MRPPKARIFCVAAEWSRDSLRVARAATSIVTPASMCRPARWGRLGSAIAHRRVPHDLLLSGLGHIQRAGDPTLAHDHNPVAHAQNLWQFRGDHDDGLALACQVV